jgi:hypothetical protein
MLSELPCECSIGVRPAAKDISSTGAVINCISMWRTVRLPSPVR